MKGELVWQEGMKFQGTNYEHQILMDARSPIGTQTAMTPKELVLMGLAGCTAMDVVALLKKHRQPLSQFSVEIEMTPTEKVHPIVFSAVKLHFKCSGQVDPERLKESVHLSQTRFCGVSAMLSQTVPIQYIISLNDQVIGEGHADFKMSSDKS